MKKILFLVFFIMIIIKVNVKAQGEAAVPFLTIQPSSGLLGMASAFTSLPTKDTFGFFYNPAQLGIFSQTENLSYQYMKVDWLPSFNFSDLYFKANGFSLGYNFNSEKLPISIGLGYLRSMLNLGENIAVDEQGNVLYTFKSKEWYDAISIGLSYNYLFNISFGFTYKSIVSDLSPNARTNPKAGDLGFLFTFPISNYFPGFFAKLKNTGLTPFTDISLGFSFNNIGNEVAYNDTLQKDPLPREAKIGYSLNIGLTYVYQEEYIYPIQLSWSVEANDLLIKRDQSGGVDYQYFLGDINIFKNVFAVSSDENVTTRYGFRINLLELIIYSRGYFSSGWFDKIKTSGFSISSRGLFKLLSISKNSIAFYIFKHLDIQYNRAKYIDDIQSNKFEGFSINIHSL